MSSFRSRLKTGIANNPTLSYFILSFAITWAIFAPVAAGQNGIGWLSYTLPDGAILLLFIIAASGPLTAALIVTRISGGEIRRFLGRIIQWRAGIGWYLIAIFAPLLIWLIAYSILMNGLPLVLLLNHAPMAISIFFSQLLVGLFIPSLGEEPGWRGFALPRLQSQYHPVIATVILGTLHGLWHIPAIAVPALLGPLNPENLLTFLLTSIGATFLYVLVYNHSKGSVLPVIVLHASSNAASSMLSNLFLENNVGLELLPIPYRWLNVIAFGTMALIIIIATKGQLSYKKERTSPVPEISPPVDNPG